MLRALAILAFLAVALPGMEHLRVKGMTQLEATKQYEDVYYLPPSGWLPALSLGYRDALADLVWLKSLLYFTDEILHRGESHYVFEYSKAMLTLDPYFHRVYGWVAMAGVYRAQDVGAETMLETIAFLEQGVRLFPDDGDLAWDTASTLLYEIAPHMPRGPERSEVKRRGYAYLARAARLGAGPPWIGLTAATDLVRLGQIQRAIDQLEEMARAVDDPGVRAEIALRVRALEAESAAEGARTAGALLEERRRRDFPYLSMPLYRLVGPRDLTDGEFSY
jgi:hypothetical protein